MATALHRREDQWPSFRDGYRAYKRENEELLFAVATTALSQCNFGCSIIKDRLAESQCFRIERENRITHFVYSLKRMSIQQAVFLSLSLSLSVFLSLYPLIFSSLFSLWTVSSFQMLSILVLQEIQPPPCVSLPLSVYFLLPDVWMVCLVLLVVWSCSRSSFQVSVVEGRSYSIWMFIIYYIVIRPYCKSTVSLRSLHTTYVVLVYINQTWLDHFGSRADFHIVFFIFYTNFMT